MNACLYIVSTPIGNMEDITLRAIRILKEVDFILCEDTRVTKGLLDKYDIRKEMVSFNAQSEEKKIEYAVNRLRNGENAAIVSDAGTPLISDPGVRLVSAVTSAGIQVAVIPGASSVLAALTLSALPSDNFIFEGFIPLKKGRQTFLKSLQINERTVIFLESVHRIEKLIGELNQYIPDRKIAVCRELTKMFEEVWRGTASEIFADLSNRTIKGEFVIVVAPRDWV